VTSDPSICAIVVSFNPDVAVLVNLARQLDRNDCDYVLVDNGSGNIEDFADTLLACARCKALIRLDENRGLAAAINIGLLHLRDVGCRFAVLFDQDSHIGPTYCRDILEAWEEAVAISGDRVAAIGPRLQDPDTGRRTPFREFDRMFFRSDRRVTENSSLYHTGFLISSGTLVPIAVLADVGLMRDEYFIDNIDVEWCFRARSLGYELYGTDRAVLYHRIGEPSDNLLVRHGILVKHSPLRSYYSTRNRINLYRQRYAPLGWKVRDFCRFVLKSLWLLVFSAQRRDYWRNIRRGIDDARTMP
jgi:rhamnosyltransferase